MPPPVLIEIYCRLNVMRQDTQWEMKPYDVLVWKADNGKITVSPLKVPTNYVQGLVYANLNGVTLTLVDLDVELKKLNTTRADIMKAIK